MASATDIKDSLQLLDLLLRDVATALSNPTKAERRVAARKLDRIVAIASTLAATIHTPRQ